MSAVEAASGRDPHHLGSGHGGHGSGELGSGKRGAGSDSQDHGGQASNRVIVGYGFWLFLLSDIVMFSGFFATYAVLVGQTAGGPDGKQIFDLNTAALETLCLLVSSGWS